LYLKSPSTLKDQPKIPQALPCAEAWIKTNILGWIFNTSVVKKHPVLPRNSMPNNEKLKRPDLKAASLSHSGGTVPDFHRLPFTFSIKYSFNLLGI